MFSQKGVEASKKKNQKQNTANQIAPEISLKLFKVKVLQVFYLFHRNIWDLWICVGCSSSHA